MERFEIEQAKRVNLGEYLIRQGVKLKKSGKDWRSLEHDSLVFSHRGYYTWNSKQESGTAIDYLVKYMDYTFPNAVKELLSFGGNISASSCGVETFNVANLKLTSDIRRSIAYLTKIRKLDMKIINMLLERKLLAQQQDTNNICFLIADRDKQIVGAELNTSLSNKRFKQIATGTKYGYGFNMGNTKEPQNAIFFESVIDLLSFGQWIGATKFAEKLKTNIFVSLAGLKEHIIKHTIETYNIPKQNIFLAVDNPKFEAEQQDGTKAAGNFINLIIKKYGIGEKNIILPPNKKDWNDIIKGVTL